MKSPKWVQWLYDKFGKKLQPAADQIKKMKLPPDVDKLFDNIWNNLSPELQKAFWDFIKKIIEDYGEDTAVAIISMNLRTLNNV